MFRILLTIITLILLPLASARAEVVDRIAAVVNNDIVTTVQLDKALAERQAAEVRGTAPDVTSPVPQRREVLDSLIEERLLEQRAAELGIKVGEEEVTAAIQDVLRQNKLTQPQLVEALRFQGIDFADYQDNLRKQILRFKLLGREMQSRIEVTNHELREYYQAHLDDYRQAGYVRLSRLTFPLAKTADAAQVAAVRSQAEAARSRLLAGETWQEVVAATPGADGGDMGSFAPGELTPAFEAAVGDLQPGQVSAVIEAPGGLHLLLVTERQPGAVKSFDSVKEQIESTLAEQKKSGAVKAWLQELKQKARIEIRL